MARVVPRREMTLAEKSYVPEVLKGLKVTMEHFLKGFVRPDSIPAQSYPEEPSEVLPTYRAQHRLMKRPDGEPRCVACFMCSTACPANCISIVADESADPRIEKKPKSFEIDLLVCVFCGLCAEACPVDAIRMDTRKIGVIGRDRKRFKVGMKDLMDWVPSDYPLNDVQSQRAPGGALNAQAREQWARKDEA